MPVKYSRKISISISQEPDVATREGKGEGRLEQFFSHLYSLKSDYGFKNLQINVEEDIRGTSRVQAETFANFFKSENVDVSMVRTSPYKGKALNNGAKGLVDEVRLMNCQFDPMKPAKGKKIEVKTLFLWGTNFLISGAVDVASI